MSIKKPSLFLETPWKTFSYAIKPSKGRFLLLVILATAGNVLGSSFPYFFKVITDQVIAHPGKTSFNNFITPIVFISITLVLHEIMFRIAHALEIYIATDAFKHITTSLFEGLIKRPTSYFENKFSGDLGRRIEQVGTAVVYFIESFPWQFSWILVTFITAFVLLCFTHVYIILTFLVWLLIFISTAAPLLIWHHKVSSSVAGYHARLTGNIVDTVSNIGLVHSFGASLYEQTRNQNVVDEVMESERRLRWISLYNKFQQGMSITLLAISLTVMSAILFSQGQFTVGDFILVAAIIPSLAGVIWNLGDFILQASRHYGELSDATAQLREHQEQLLGGEVHTLESEEYPIHFNAVAFQYPGTKEAVFKNFTLQIDQGEHIGIVGTSGAGKSTLIKLLLRQYDIVHGTVSISSVSIQDYSLEILNQLISYVPQDTSLFHRTLYENIHYANPQASKKQVFEASEKAHAHEFISALPEGYNTKVGERGVKLSGGQRQRIALARAILKNAPILILDEATSSLDTESESLIQQALTELFENRTVIAIAHRLSTLKAMDKIVVIENGIIVESGNPQELLKHKKGFFKEMWERQKNGFI